MDRPVELIPLVCLRCTTPVPAVPGERAWVCRQCGQGMSLDESEGLQKLDIHYSSGIPAARPGRPFWVSEGRVSVARETYGFGNSEKEARTFWEKPRRFFIPAFTCSLEDMLKFGSDFLMRPPAVQAGPAVQFLPVTLALADVKAAAEFIVVAIEAGRKDKLKRLQVDLNLAPPELWIFP